MFRQLATDALGTLTNFKHCEPDAMRLLGCCTSCLLLYSGHVSMVMPVVVVVTPVHADAPTYILLSAIATGLVPREASLVILERFNLVSCSLF